MAVTQIKYAAFSNNKTLTYFEIPASITSMPNALYNCTNLAEIVLADGFPAIPDQAFRNCTGLVNITLPMSVTSIGYSAFRDCSKATIKVLQTDISKIIFKDATTPANSESESKAFRSVKAILVPKASEAAYKKAPIWDYYKNIISGY